MSTIMKRAVDALRASGHTAEADELLNHVGSLKGNVEEILKLVEAQGKTVKLFVNTVQSRCLHPVFCLSDEVKFEIACYTCGHTVCDEKTYKFAKEITKGWGVRASLHHKGGSRFTLPLPVRNELGKKLIVEEIKDGEV